MGKLFSSSDSNESQYQQPRIDIGEGIVEERDQSNSTKVPIQAETGEITVRLLVDTEFHGVSEKHPHLHATLCIAESSLETIEQIKTACTQIKERGIGDVAAGHRGTEWENK